MKKAISISILFVLPFLSFAQWTQIGNSINGQAAGDQSGRSTAISADGTIVAIGSPNSSIASANAGQVRVFGLNNGTWAQIGSAIYGESFGDVTGTSVSLSNDGSILAIGEPNNNDLGFPGGQVRVFKNLNNNWSQIGQDLYGENSSAGAGGCVDLSADGSVMAFGAQNTTVNGMFFAGKVKVFENQNNTWVQKGGDINGDGTIVKFGQRVSLSDDGNIVAISQTGDPITTNPPQLGRVKVYQFVNNQWTQIGNTIFGLVSGDEFGWWISLSATGNILAISSASSNVVLVYQLNGGTWTQIGNTLVGENPGDLFGSSVHLSSDGSVLGVGARWNGTDGFRRGRAYVFKNQGGNWTQINNTMLGVINDDQFGTSLALSQNGSRVVVGANNNDTAGNNAGEVRIFENTTLSTPDFDSNSFSFYPNPSSNLVTFSSNNSIEHITIYNLLGQEVLTKLVNSNEFSIDISNLSTGSYVAKLTQNEKSQSVKLLKL
uniref:T9SS type A sorting domain-containing protein n=1 Tax=Flavobacterium sp. TaxID=239 RepID=UPI00404997BC